MCATPSASCRVSTLHDAAKLLSGAGSPSGALRIADALGFGDAHPLDRQAREALGLTEDARTVRVATGPGVLRVALVVAPTAAVPRQAAARVATRLAERSPHFLWLACVVHTATGTLIVAVPPAAGTHQTSALVVDTNNVQDSDAESLSAMIAACGASDVLTHHRWRELLGREALTRRFYRELEAAVGELAASATGPAPESARREIALLCSSRLLFLKFLEAKGWLDGDRAFLRRHFDAQCAAGGRVQQRFLDPLFFGTLNTPFTRRAAAARALGRVPFLNGGLFARAPIEQQWRGTTLSDDALGRVIGDLLGRYRVTAREESTSWSEAAVDPEMLGRAFECLMATDDRRRSGAFYTPSAILERVTAEGIDEWLAERGTPVDVRRAIRAGEPIVTDARADVLQAVAAIRVLDPACGSGAFLVHVLERLADIMFAAGDTRPAATRRREVLTRSLFGVDINPMAVWLCELRLWLSVVIDADDRDAMAVAPLPNLDHHVRVGDALAGDAFGDGSALAGDTALCTLRRRYTTATGARKRTFARALDREERRLCVTELERQVTSLAARRRDVVTALRGRDLFDARILPSAEQRCDAADLRRLARDARRRLDAVRRGAALPFSFRAQFADAGEHGGFDLIVGNPPWVRLHRVTPAQRLDLARRYRSWREASWTDGATETGAGRGFSSQVDLAALFVERATQLVRPGGVISLLVPAKLWSSLSAGGVRRVLADECRLVALEDWSESRAAFDAVVYPSLVVARRERGAQPAPCGNAIHRRDRVLAWECDTRSIALDSSPGAPWLIVPPAVRQAFDLLTARGVRLARSPLGRPLLGVKTGCNDAFIVTPPAGWRDEDEQESPRSVVRAGERTDEVERALLRPVLRGEDVRAWRANATTDAILWTHDADGSVLRRLPEHASRWLAPWRRQLIARTDAARVSAWWSLFRTEAARCDLPRVVWSDISRVPRALVLDAGDPTVALNSCYVARTADMDDAHTLAVLLNSPPTGAWLAALAEPARGGYRRYLGWTLSRFPLPADWGRARRLLAPVGRAARDGVVPDPATLAAIVARAYGVRLSRLEPLMTWCLR